jgi:hypothetical protein
MEIRKTGLRALDNAIRTKLVGPYVRELQDGRKWKGPQVYSELRNLVDK